MSRRAYFASIDSIRNQLDSNKYITDLDLATMIYLSYHLNKPILLEGEPGVGKTEVAIVLSQILESQLIRLQCYEGLDAGTALYEWNYPKQFNESYGRRMLSGKTIAIIFSDGWDLGETDILESQMAYLHSKAHRVIWLNPLIGTQDYQPICQGMSTALPYVDHFLPMGNVEDLQYLAKTLIKMVA
jgi:VWA domain containing CoxE-like protein/AAA domain (dynein-related subfamily)